MIRVSIDNAARELASRLNGTSGRLFIPGGPGEPLGLLAALRADPALAAGLTFVGAHVPGINRTDWASLHETARAEGTFLSGDWRSSGVPGLTPAWAKK